MAFIKKFTLFYIGAALIISFVLISLVGVTGHEGLISYYVLMGFTFPIGLVPGHFGGLLFKFFPKVPYVAMLFFSSFILNYIQWIFIILIVQNLKQKRQQKN